VGNPPSKTGLHQSTAIMNLMPNSLNISASFAVPGSSSSVIINAARGVTLTLLQQTLLIPIDERNRA
jgi:hypothetical protein